ncbi:hypothetical protein ACFO1S_23735 [Cohnella boryungensis]|uniref:Uncharacterized protein n=1 Tax=Cohnella boryungensis TaxID=768479 RepID=A0ABV8SGQ0_9BACL
MRSNRKEGEAFFRMRTDDFLRLDGDSKPSGICKRYRRLIVQIMEANP